ncbi:MAG TPA: nuclear transport factor 2 family protein [Burkholderiaceae bacterium]
MKSLLLAGMVVAFAVQAADSGIEAFNKALSDATTRMDNAATMALWDDEGASLLPSTGPILGKKAIAGFLDKVASQYPGAHMKSFEMQCSGIEQSGDWASEWCDEHQVVDLGNGKPPFDGHGRMLLVLHRGAEGKWRLRREMWQPN